jgi:(p)ppGpp synthase/HD superfamily hydrolase
MGEGQDGGLLLSERFTEAVEYARGLHTEFRKGTRIPYMAHLVGVAALVMGEAGRRVPVTEEMVIAALLHDTVEDHGGQKRLDEVREKFGGEVARMVEGLSDTLAEDHDKKEGWEERKVAYIRKLREEKEDVLLISAADKLYNAKSILDDYKEIGAEVWKRFKRGPEKQMWYFRELLKVFEPRLGGRLVKELEAAVQELTRRVGV